MTTVILLDWKRGPVHDRLTIFIGPDRDHLANAGELAFRIGESLAFRQSIRSGIGAQNGLTGFFERGWE